MYVGAVLADISSVATNIGHLVFNCLSILGDDVSARTVPEILP